MANKSVGARTKSFGNDLPTATIKEMANRLNPNSPYYEHEHNKRPHFAIFLGAGASVESGISDANKIIDEFRKRICAVECPEMDKDKEKDDWLRVNRYFKEDKDRYGSLFERCYPTEVDRREYIESQVDGKVPSLGYIALAHLIRAKIVDTILTTNFDDLIYIACTSYTDERPVVYSLGGFASEISGTTNRPRVLKLHGDFLFSDIKNTSKELEEQDPNMSQQVQQILESYRGLVVIGYRGKDDSIIKLLTSIPKGKYLYWCVYQDERVTEDVEKLIREKNGWIVRHNGFDKLFDEIRRIVEIKDEAIFSLFEERRKKLEDEIGKFNPEKFEVFKNAADANNAGIIFFNDGNLSEAEKSYRIAISINPDYVSAHYNLGLVLAKDKSRLKEAEEAYWQAIEINPHYVSAYINLGLLLAKDKSRFKEAEQLYREAIAINPDPDAYSNLGNLLKKDKSRWVESEENHRKAIEINPLMGCYLRNLGDLLSKQNKDKAALEYIEKSVELDPHCPNHLPALASIYYKLKDTEKMKLAIDRAKIETSELSPYSLACFASLLKNKDEAFRCLRKAFEVDPSKKEDSKTDLDLEWIRDDPRFQDLLRSQGVH